jgi:hypothetical protein
VVGATVSVVGLAVGSGVGVPVGEQARTTVKQRRIATKAIPIALNSFLITLNSFHKFD